MHNNCVSKLDFVKTKIIYFLFFKTSLFIYFAYNNHLIVVLIRHVILKNYFLRPQLKTIFLNLFFKNFNHKANTPNRQKSSSREND